MSSDIIVSAQGVDVYYDKSQILFGIDFELRQGQKPVDPTPYMEKM